MSRYLRENPAPGVYFWGRAMLFDFQALAFPTAWEFGSKLIVKVIHDLARDVHSGPLIQIQPIYVIVHTKETYPACKVP